MFDLVRRLKQKDDVRSGDDGSQLRVLAVTQNESEWKSLRDIASQCGWLLFWAHSCDAALEVLARYTIPVVICDRDLPGQDWRSTLERLRLVSHQVSILLVSSVADEYLWREVVQHQGFDVLCKPFQPERLIRMVNLAWSWEGWMQRSSNHTSGAG